MSLDKTIPIIASPGTVTQSFGPGTGEDGLVDDYAAFGSAQRYNFFIFFYFLPFSFFLVVVVVVVRASSFSMEIEGCVY